MNKRSLLNIGNSIQKGPTSIYAKPRTSYHYLLDSFSIKFHCETYKAFKTYQIFCDGEGSEERGYLPTMMRIANWNRDKDLKNSDSIDWPNVEVKYFKFLSFTPPLQELVSEVQRQLDKPRLDHFGLPELRYSGPGYAESLGDLSIKSWAGGQKIERSFYLGPEDDFKDIFDRFNKVITEHGVEDKQENWLERYDLEWAAYVGKENIFWDGRPKEIKKGP